MQGAVRQVTVWDTAIHESGHVVVGLELGKEVEFARIFGSDIELGKTKFKHGIIDWDKIDIGDGLDRGPIDTKNQLQRRGMTICVAGDVANNIDHKGDWRCIIERIDPEQFYKRTIETFRGFANLEDGSDMQKALTWADELPEEPLDEIKMAEAQAREILERRWNDVLILADRLLSQRWIGPRQIDILLRR